MQVKIIIIGTVSSSIFGFRYHLLKELKNRNCKVIFYLSDVDEELVQRAKDELAVECRIYPLSRSSTNPLHDLQTLKFLYKEFQKEQPDAVFSFFSKPVIWGTLAAWLAKVPRRIAMLEGLGYSFTNQPTGFSKKQKLIQFVQVFLYRIALPRTTNLIFLNPDDPKDLLEKHSIKAQKLSLLGGIGVDLERFSAYENLNMPEGALRFLFIGRLLAEKGINEYVEAAALVKNKYPNATFTVLGKIDEENPGGLKPKELEVLKSKGVIEYPGHVSNIDEWLRQHDVYVLPSYREGVPASTQEAMACGKAIITTNVPGCRETVVEGLNGLFVPPWDAQKLADKMVWMIENPRRVQEMGIESRKLAEERFDAVKQSNQLADWILM